MTKFKGPAFLIQVLLLLPCLFAVELSANEQALVYPAISDNSVFDPKSDIRYFKEGAVALTAQEVFEELDSIEWQRPAGGSEIRRTTDRYWFAIQFSFSDSEPRHLALSVLQHRAKLIDVYVYQDNELILSDRAGMSIAKNDSLFSQRQVVPLLVEGTENYTVLLRVDAQEYLYFNHFQLEPLDLYLLRFQGQSLKVGSFIGIGLTVALFNLILLAILREWPYPILVLWIAFVSQHLLSFYGLGLHLWFDGLAAYQRELDFLSHAGANLLAVAFAMAYLKTRTHTPVLHRFLIAYIAIQSLVLTVPLIASLSLGMASNKLLSVVVIPLVLIAGSLRWREGRRDVRFYVLGSSILATYAIFLWLSALWFPQWVFFAWDQFVLMTGAQMIFISMSEIERINRIIRQRNRAKHEAMTDSLTNVPNRRAFISQFRQARTYCRENSLPLSCIMIDIDFFKRYNDHLGHVAGDDCLHMVAQTIKQQLSRGHDSMARYGGEEFVVLLPGAGENAVARFCTALAAAFEDKAIYHPDSPLGERISLSMGAVTVEPKEPLSINQLVAAADSNLYYVKQSGRDNWRWTKA